MSRFAAVFMEAGPGLPRRGWYVRDLSVTGCVVLVGGHHVLAIQARQAAEIANGDPRWAASTPRA